MTEKHGAGIKVADGNVELQDIAAELQKLKKDNLKYRGDGTQDCTW